MALIKKLKKITDFPEQHYQKQHSEAKKDSKSIEL